MTANPLLGVLLHWLGGLASASFYIPFRGVKRWSWETHWLVGGVFSWLVAPWAMATLLVPGFLGILVATPPRTLFWVYLFGAMWGLGGLTFGLTMRYLGIALGMAIALGYCAAFGTLMPPIFTGQMATLVEHTPGRIVLAGVAVCLAGILVSGLAGMSKEREASDEQKRAVIREFAFARGVAVATFSGIMSSCFSFALAAGAPIARAARDELLRTGRPELWRNMPVLIVLLLGGFTSNFIWCVILHARNHSGREYLSPTRIRPGAVASGSVIEAVPLLRNYAFSALAGVTWYMQYFFYGMGETKMGKYGFSSWTLHMASIIIFSTLWGVALREWSGSSRRTRTLVAVGLGVLVLSTVIVGYGNSLHAAPASTVSVRDPRCEYASNPIGVETTQPRLSWQLVSPARGQRQSAYQILVASSAEALAAGKGDLWDTGKVASAQSIQIRYDGRKLDSRQRCFWKVRVWDRDGQMGPYTAAAWWEMGLLDARDWRAEWIGPPPGGGNARARYFRFDFSADKAVRRARAYVAGLGYHELSVNGSKVGDHVLDPGWTEYTKRVLYVSHDVSPLLRPGANTVGVVVGNGWYGSPKLLLQLELSYADGTSARFFTAGGGARADLGGAWKVASGPILSNSIYDGEVYDARLEKPGWDVPATATAPGADASAGWDSAVAIEPPAGKLVSQQLEPIKVVDSFAPVAVKQPRPGVFVFDTGQNLAGWVELRAKAPRGTRVTLKFAENLNPDGTINRENLRKAAATDSYVFKGPEATGGADENWQPRFTYHGFRHVQVEGFPGDLTIANVTVKVVRSAVEPAGTFASSHELLNRIYRMVRATEASNLHSVPTDCPQRDERMGWMNDLTVRIDQAVYNFRMPRFYGKFLDDVADTQSPDGAITDTAPFKWGKRPADPVSASYLLLAWAMYQHYGDTRAMSAHFDGFRAWVDFVASKTKDGVVTYGSWGDWSPPAAFAIPGSHGASALARDTPLPLMSTGYLYLTSKLVSEMAGVIDRPVEQRRYQTLADTTARAFDQAFWNETTGGYGANNQAANSFALFLGLVPAARVPRVVANLVADVARNDGHLTTGNLCTKYLLEMLTQHGHADVALQVATQKTYPSWGFMLDNGATTLWERWEHLTGGQMNSHNHPMMGSVGSWFYKYLAGILPDPTGPGFRRFIVRPHALPGLDWVRGSYESMYGRIDSAWKRDGRRLRLSVTVPVNATATIVVPATSARRVTEGGKPATSAPGVRLLHEEAGAAVFEVGSGAYEFATE